MGVGVGAGAGVGLSVGDAVKAKRWSDGVSECCTLRVSGRGWCASDTCEVSGMLSANGGAVGGERERGGRDEEGSNGRRTVESVSVSVWTAPGCETGGWGQGGG